MWYLVKTPWWLKKLYPHCTWEIKTSEKKIYLSFDDGPHPVATAFVLEQLRQYNAKATFFCIGNNVASHPQLYRQLLNEGHAVGNHTHDHPNAWHTTNEKYFDNIKQAAALINSAFFRPPYGKISNRQVKLLARPPFNLKTIMWTVLSADFDTSVSKEKCLHHVVSNTKAGSIVVFHDSEKAFGNLKYALPKVLEHFSAQGFAFEKL